MCELNWRNKNKKGLIFFFQIVIGDWGGGLKVEKKVFWFVLKDNQQSKH